MTKNYILLFFLLSSFIVCRAQTETYQINWTFGANGGAADLTIEVGDTVEWVWGDSGNHTVTSQGGSTETFDSGAMNGLGNIFSVTFNQIGSNNYLCSFHPGSMSGIITVVADGTLSNKDFSLESFNISPNPAKSFFKLELPNQINKVNLQVYDVLGKEILNKYLSSESIVDISGWNNGIYLVKVSSDNISHVKRFIKQ